MLMQFVEAAAPKVVFLENVTGFAENGEWEFVFNTFKAAGYISGLFTIEASRYGSLPVRERIYIVALRSKEVGLQVCSVACRGGCILIVSFESRRVQLRV